MFLADTNVISELTKPKPNAGVVEWAARVTRLDLSAITLEEILYGLSRKPNTRIQTWLERFIAEQCRVIPISEQVARIAGTIRGRLAARGQRRTQADMLIAATAQVHQLTLVTRNVRDFDECGVAVLDPFR